jgi:hypothetical protein
MAKLKSSKKMPFWLKGKAEESDKPAKAKAAKKPKKAKG